MAQVVESVVKSDLCIGCGICASLCPEKNLGIRSNMHGEYNPYYKNECSSDCGLCYRVCPFGNGNPNEDEIGKERFDAIANMQHDSVTGYYLECFVGGVASEAKRERSASGGLATWLLTNLLSKGQIDAAICVSPSNETDTLFKYSVMKDINGIESGSGSAYYPVQLSDVLSYIMRTPGRYAITALPCFAKGIRLAQMKSKVLEERIVCIIGITCGQMKGKHYTHHLAALSGVRGELSKVHYRGKDDSHPASNYYFSCENAKGERGKIFWNEGVSEAWLNRWFTLNPCNYCDDIFAECADVVCMDAWLPDHVNDWRGTSLILIRSSQLLRLVRNGIDGGELSTALVPIDKINQSQSELVAFKRRDLRTRIWMAERAGIRLPVKRVNAKRELSKISVMYSHFLMEIQIQSKERYLDYKDRNESDLIPFRECMEPYQRRLRTLQKCMAASHIPLAFMRKLRGDDK